MGLYIDQETERAIYPKTYLNFKAHFLLICATISAQNRGDATCGLEEEPQGVWRRCNRQIPFILGVKACAHLQCRVPILVVFFWAL
jgi:hypothetical protein